MVFVLAEQFQCIDQPSLNRVLIRVKVVFSKSGPKYKHINPDGLMCFGFSVSGSVFKVYEQK